MKKQILLLFFFFFVVISFSDTVVLSPTDDMYTDVEHAGTNPILTELWTANFPTSGHYERIMIKFDLDSYSQNTLISAELHLTRFFSCPSSGTTAAAIYGITENWDENAWNYTQHTTYDPSLIMPYVFTGNPGDAITDFNIDVTDFINNWFINPIDNNGFVIIAESNQKFSKFYSKEHSNPDYQPYLSLEFANSDAENSHITTDMITASNYPNPFNPSTTIEYCISEDSYVDIDLYNFKGQKIDCLYSSFQCSGFHSLTFNGCTNDGRHLQSGVYYYRIKSNNVQTTRSMVLLK